MLSFILFLPERGPTRVVHVNPAAVASVMEEERRPSDAFYQPVAVITLLTGDVHVVYDYARDVAAKINRAVEGKASAALLHALQESVKLQSRYARLLNQTDGGTRVEFANAEAWLDRLEEVARAAKS